MNRTWQRGFEDSLGSFMNRLVEIHIFFVLCLFISVNLYQCRSSAIDLSASHSFAWRGSIESTIAESEWASEYFDCSVLFLKLFSCAVTVRAGRFPACIFLRLSSIGDYLLPNLPQSSTSHKIHQTRSTRSRTKSKSLFIATLAGEQLVHSTPLSRYPKRSK